MIDTHCHIDDPQYATDLDTFLRAQQTAGVEKILVPGVNAASIASVSQVCRLYPDYLYPAIGLHPEEVKDDWETQLSLIEDALRHSNHATNNDCPQDAIRYIAIGEIGLDYHFDTTYKEQQQWAFLRQLHWAVEQDLPVMVHSRDATEDTLRLIREVNLQAQSTPHQRHVRGVMHCFSGSHETAQTIIHMGLYLGIGGVITFKNCHLSDHLQGIPLDRIVLETDAPYMAPVPHRGQRNESRWMRQVAEKLSEVYDTPIEEIIHITTQNAKELFHI